MESTPPMDADFLTIYRIESRRLRRRLATGMILGLLVLGGALACTVTQPMATPEASQKGWMADPQRLEAHVRFLSVDCRPRDWSSPAGLAKAEGYIATAFLKSGGRTWKQSFEVRGRTFTNLGVSFGPESGPRLVLGAHYDACGDLPAADDNASGVAGILELARRLGSIPPGGRVDLVAYTLEEPPFFRTSNMGSAHHAASLAAEHVQVRAMISLEMIGRFSDVPGTQHIPFPLSPFYPDRGDFIAIVGRFSDIGLTRKVKSAMRAGGSLSVRSLTGPRWIPGVDFSDHYPFWDHGFPAVMITDTAFNRNRDYHTEGDTPDKLDYRRMAQVIQGVEWTIRVLTR
jgi:hypothetical protein